MVSRSAVAATPGLRGLALGYTLLPTAWAHGQQPHANPGLRGLALGYTLSPTAWAEMSKPDFTNRVGGIPALCALEKHRLIQEGSRLPREVELAHRIVAASAACVRHSRRACAAQFGGGALSY